MKLEIVCLECGSTEFKSLGIGFSGGDSGMGYEVERYKCLKCGTEVNKRYEGK